MQTFMENHQIITRIDHNDPRCKAAVAAEQRLFALYGLDYTVHFVEMEEPNLCLRVLEVGEGRPLLMVPGGAGDAVFFAPIMAQLKGWRVIAINRPGGGMSDGVDHRRVDVRRLAVNTLRTVADHFGLDRVPIVCNSMGGLWSFWYALEYPERVSQMVQMGCPALFLDTSAPFFMRLLSVPGINSLVVKAMQPKSEAAALDGLRFQGSSREDIDRMPQEIAAAAYHFFNLPTYLDTWKTLVSAVASLRGANPRYALPAEELARVQQPVQFIWGANDPFGSLYVARQAAQIIPNARLHEMNTGHLPFLDQPEETGRVIRQFLAEDGQ
ncbi:MAG: alpha/beta hydrolase [Chloroflexi bacterium]|nr:MAG: alpha/beta hydrolase [Chloroflexota bacterium]